MEKTLTMREKLALRKPFDLTKEAVREVEAILQAQVGEFDEGLVPYTSHVLSASGKHLRPMLAVLAGGATMALSGGRAAVKPEHVKLGAVLEMVHLATLVHDDIIDEAEVRRQVPTANVKWGAGLAVLLGDALFSQALVMACDFGDPYLTREIAKASRMVCEGEIIQTQRRFDLTLRQQDYFRVIEMKTGALFAAATGLAGYLSGAPKEVERAFYRYGMELGVAYQIYDDCLDLVGTEDEFGKTLRTDLVKGKLTLPMLYLLEGADGAQRAKLERRIVQQEPLDLSVLVGIADYEGAVERALDKAVEINEGAAARLEIVPTSEYREALEGISAFVRNLLVKLR